jgi:hypothetical protein
MSIVFFSSPMASWQELASFQRNRTRTGKKGSGWKAKQDFNLMRKVEKR